MYACVRLSDPLEQKTQAVVNCYVSAGELNLGPLGKQPVLLAAANSTVPPVCFSTHSAASPLPPAPFLSLLPFL